MLLRSNFILPVLLLASCTPSSKADATALSVQADASDLKDAVEKFSDAVISRNFSVLKAMMLSNDITFDRDGNIDPDIACFLHWIEACPYKNKHISDILKSRHFVYFYHLDEYNVIISFIKEEGREAFYAEPSVFLEDKYLSEYFSCQFIKSGGRWLLKESLCFSETEGPFVPEPDV